MYGFKAYRDKGLLRVDADIDDGAVSFALVAKDIDKLEFVVYSHRSDIKSKVVFLRDEVIGKVAYVTYDRYLYRKV